MSQIPMGTPSMGGVPQAQRLYGRQGPQMGPGQIQQVIQNMPQAPAMGGGAGWGGAGHAQFPQNAMPQGSFSGPGTPGGAYVPGSFSAGVAALNRGSPFAGGMLNSAAGLPGGLGGYSSQGAPHGGAGGWGAAGPFGLSRPAQNPNIPQNPLGITPQMQGQIRGSFPQMGPAGGGMPQFAMPQRPFSPLAGEGYSRPQGQGQIPNLQPMAGGGGNPQLMQQYQAQRQNQAQLY
jgi:hypothetical protein